MMDIGFCVGINWRVMNDELGKRTYRRIIRDISAGNTDRNDDGSKSKNGNECPEDVTLIAIEGREGESPKWHYIPVEVDREFGEEDSVEVIRRRLDPGTCQNEEG
jgi:hypothetical protein